MRLSPALALSAERRLSPFRRRCVIELPRPGRRFATAWPVHRHGFSARSYVRSSDWLTNEIFTLALWPGRRQRSVVLNLGQYAPRDNIPRGNVVSPGVTPLPSYLIARNNLADALYNQGKTEEADARFAKQAPRRPKRARNFRAPGSPRST